jgi:hypothetical protein
MDNSIKLDFDQARIKHMLFKSKLRSILYGSKTDELPILNEREYPVGKWLYGHALQKYNAIPEARTGKSTYLDAYSSAGINYTLP